MRRFRDRQSAGIFRGNELARIMTLVVMLGVLGMMMRRARDEDTWRFFTGEPAKLSTDSGESAKAAKPRARPRHVARRTDAAVVQAPEEGVEFHLPLAKAPAHTAATADTAKPTATSDTAAPSDSGATANEELAAAPGGRSGEPKPAPLELAAATPADEPAANPDTPPASAASTTGDEDATTSTAAASGAAPAATASEEKSAEAKTTDSQTEDSKTPESKAADSTTAVTTPDATPSESTKAADATSAEKPVDTTADKPVYKPLDRPNKPANPEVYLDPNAVPEKPDVESGPLDEDPEERKAFDHEVEPISDNSPISVDEMFAYNRMLRWAHSQTTEEMLRRARTNIRFDDLLNRPGEFRGDIISVKLHILRVREEDAPPDNPLHLTHYYQAVGWNDASQAWFYHCVFEDLPKEMKIGERVYEEGTFVGYFFKDLVYLDGRGTKIKSPVLIGRMVYHATPSMAKDPNEWMWGAAIGGVLVLLFAARWGLRLWRPAKATTAARLASQRPALTEAGELAVPLEDWLDQAQSPGPVAEIKTPDHHDQNGSTYGNGHSLHPGRGLDWTEDGER